MATDRKWIRDGLITADKSQRDLSEALGISEASMSLLLAGKRGLKENELYKICTYLNVFPPNLTSLSVPKNTPDQQIKVTGVAMTGVFRSETAVSPPIQFAPPPAVDNFRGYDQFVLYVQETGALAYYIPYFAFRTRVTVGDIVYVRQSRDDGLFEDAIRKVTEDDDTLWLIADSGDRLSASSHAVEVKGFVTGIWTPANSIAL